MIDLHEVAGQDYGVADRTQDPGLSLLLTPLMARKRLILKCTLAALLCGVLVSFIWPSNYTATARILPPQQSQSIASSMMGQLGTLAGLTGGASSLGLKNPADLYVGILKSSTISDDIIKKFGLQQYYRARYLSATRKSLAEHSGIEAGKDGIITIEFTCHQPALCADVANQYVDELFLANQRLAITEAGQRRLFFEKEVNKEKENLAQAELAFKQMEEKTGIIQPTAQAEAVIHSVAQIRAELATKEVQLRALGTFATDNNPEVVRTREEIAGLNAQLSKLESDRRIGRGDINLPTSKIPELSLDYLRTLREFRYQEELFQMLSKQYEIAKIDEGKSASLIQVVDHAMVPDHRSGPNRLLIAAFGAIAGALAASLVILYQHRQTLAF